MLDHGHLDARLGEADEPLVRIHEDRRRRAEQDLLRVCVERDYRGARAAVRCLVPKPPQQIFVAAVEAVEHPHDDEQRAVIRAKRIEPCDQAGVGLRFGGNGFDRRGRARNGDVGRP